MVVPKWSGPRRNAPAAAAAPLVGSCIGVFGAGDQDALDGAIATGRRRRCARAQAASQAVAPVFVAQPEHPLRRPQVMDGVIGA